MGSKKRKKIKYRAPYEIPAVSDYTVSVAKFIKHVEYRLKRKNIELKRLGAGGENAKEYLESMIDTEFITMLRKYEKIKSNDCIQINKAINRRKSDKKEYLKLLSMIDIEIASLNTEYLKLEKMYKRCNPLYKGRLKIDGINTEVKENIHKDGGSDTDG